MEGNVLTFHKRVRLAFLKVKRDVFELRGFLNVQQESINTLSNNEKALLLRIRKLEEAASKPVQKTVEHRVVVKRTAVKKSYVGAKTSLKVHDEHCPFAKNIKPKNKVIFATKGKAFNKGFSPCDCLKK
ncbi:MAG: hypothetical protein ABIJ34_08620 [archaeon]